MRNYLFKFWLGCKFSAWMRILAVNHFKTDLRYLPCVLLTTPITLSHSVKAHIQNIIYGRRIEKTKIHDNPVFIVGHWRSGTTHLHYLLSHDPQFVAPTTSQCLDPTHILLVPRQEKKIGQFLLPKRRPMDNIEILWDSPQEDEFALCLMGLPSPYRQFAFPNAAIPYTDYLDLENLSPETIEQWKRQYILFLKQVTFLKPGKLLTKSPTHTCRMRLIREILPSARFIHIVRSPFSVIPSTINLWKTVYGASCLQKPDFSSLPEDVLRTHEHFFNRIKTLAPGLPPSAFIEIRCEDLTEDPLGQLQRIYRQLELGDFGKVRPNLERYLSKVSGHRCKTWEISEEMKKSIAERCHPMIEKYGYSYTGSIPAAS